MDLDFTRSDRIRQAHSDMLSNRRYILLEECNAEFIKYFNQSDLVMILRRQLNKFGKVYLTELYAFFHYRCSTFDKNIYIDIYRGLIKKRYGEDVYNEAKQFMAINKQIFAYSKVIHKTLPKTMQNNLLLCHIIYNIDLQKV